ncbi:MAG: hypothetical protein EOO38_06705 [Cytophagaceae bacterium]|nr:MAG: hypothetical protein EOO38_06705 [Cytophagaceae bacterium]
MMDLPPQPLTDAQVKNFAVGYKEAVVQLGQAARFVAPNVDPAHTDQLSQMLDTLERLYWMTDTLERDAQKKLGQSQIKEITYARG